MQATVAKPIKVATVAPAQVTDTYKPTHAGEPCKAWATTGATTSKVSKAMATMAWIIKVSSTGQQRFTSSSPERTRALSPNRCRHLDHQLAFTPAFTNKLLKASELAWSTLTAEMPMAQALAHFAATDRLLQSRRQLRQNRLGCAFGRIQTKRNADVKTLHTRLGEGRHLGQLWQTRLAN
jgi:hypothetical protein